MEAIVAAVSDPWHRQMAGVVFEHYRAEVVGDLDAIIATLVPEPAYRLHGSSLFGPIETTTAEETIALYKPLIDLGYPPAAALEGQRWAFADWGVVVQGTQTLVLPGAAFPGADATVDRSKAYLISYPLVGLHPFDRASGLMKGEIVFFGDLEQMTEFEGPPPLHG
jgi:hypothetical protein